MNKIFQLFHFLIIFIIKNGMVINKEMKIELNKLQIKK